MFHSEPVRTAAGRIRSTVLTAVVVVSLAICGLSSGLGETDGTVPEGVRIVDEHFPAVGNLDPVLRRALRDAAVDAAAAGNEIVVKSGWRSRAYQNQLLRDAVTKYGSEKQAARWVASADTSSHVSGRAVDVGPPRAAAWLARHGSRYGLCQIYRNERWHYELRPEAIDHGCPPMYADTAHDPRMRRDHRAGMEPASTQSRHTGRRHE